MKLKFKHQQFQTDAVESVIKCFAGQPGGLDWSVGDVGELISKNREIVLPEDEVLANVRMVQQSNGLILSDQAEGRYNLTIEMETGTGKTYTYIKTMFELNRTYGWSKFIVIVPSVAIREGVFKSFQVTEDHFMIDYGFKARYFKYNSKLLHNIESFAGATSLQVIIMNSQAFNASSKDARRIFTELDELQSRRPIDLISQVNPIIIIDEPQSVEGRKTMEALKLFNPLFTLRYSATHRQEYNKIFRLDALDAFNQKLVKKIEVKGITVNGSTGADGYLYLEGIEVSRQRPPAARLEHEKITDEGIYKAVTKVQQGDDLYQLSGGLEQYKGCIVSEINGSRNTVSFSNGLAITAGEVRGGEIQTLVLRRIQIRESIISHFAKEQYLFGQDIKVLTLFFVDEVAKYRQYDKMGSPIKGEYARIFEEEYNRIISEILPGLKNNHYEAYLRRIRTDDTHKGYFSIDKRTNRFINAKGSAREAESDDVDAYNLIIKDKERLLSFAEPTRFIFSHSALREGWDNPNVFQICTLKNSDSTIKKKQEVGRGLRLCVNANGDRMDASVLGSSVHDINRLTVVASESYEDFATQLQAEFAEALSDRPHGPARSILVGDERRGSSRHLAPKEKTLQSLPKKTYLENLAWNIDSEDLIIRCIQAINRNLTINELRYSVTTGEINAALSKPLPKGQNQFPDQQHEELSGSLASPQKYDLIGKLVQETRLSRKSVIRILTGISSAKFTLFRKNPEEFINRAAMLIKGASFS